MGTSTRPVGEKGGFSPLSCADFLAGWLHGDDKTEFRMAASIRDPGLMGRLNLVVARLRPTARPRPGEEGVHAPGASPLTARSRARSSGRRDLARPAERPLCRKQSTSARTAR